MHIKINVLFFMKDGTFSYEKELLCIFTQETFPINTSVTQDVLNTSCNSG